MPIVRIIYTGKADHPEVLKSLYDGLQGIVATELSTPDSPLSRDSIELVFENGHPFNRGKDLKILIDANDFPARIRNIDERCANIAKRVWRILPRLSGEPKKGFVYAMLSSGGLGEFEL